MKFTIEKSVIARAISHATGVVERRNTVPILSNVALIAADASLTMRASNLDLEIHLTVPAQVSVVGETTVPAQLLSDIVRKLSSSEVSFDLSSDHSTISVGAGRSKFKLQCLPFSDFPYMGVGEFSHSFSMPSAQLKTLIARTKFAISTEETRYYLNGIFMHTVDDKGQKVLRAVATDGHRLARAQTDAPPGSGEMPAVIVPRKTVGEFEKVLGDDEAHIDVSDTKIRLRCGDVILLSKLIDGTFPDYGRVIPTQNNIVALADTDAIRAATDRVATISSERGRAVKMTFAENNLHLEVTNPDSGSAEDDVAIDFPDDQPPLQIGFNAKYINDILVNVQSKRARISLADSGSPTVIRDEEGEETLYVLMPMRV
ncbi:DNA polymerase III subunit beta [Shinella zoogloeoides]|uniref:DNA polymerase III subunit beta n=1 Tax=Shinella zoogloeoides TaxID=352475 RepID=UPI00299F5228|nr:DNA polymerase III subunit beta [Shinella zoogloeoides]WPE19866.1 Beta sliding clamp [Shinella zoogloeoides]